MARFLLVHGSCHGAWCWRDTIPALAALGHRATAIDLPSHGDDPTPLAEVTLDGYADAILAAIDEPVVLVGHSMAGYPITVAAQKAPERIARLVYLCAYLPLPGLSLSQMRQMAAEQPLLHAITRSRDGTSFTVRPELATGVFYHDCPPEAAAFAIERLCPQAILPQATPIADMSRAEALPRDYIRCTDDRAIPPAWQAQMAARLPPENRHQMPTAHSPFFADPAGLAQLLHRIDAT